MNRKTVVLTAFLIAVVFAALTDLTEAQSICTDSDNGVNYYLNGNAQSSDQSIEGRVDCCKSEYSTYMGDSVNHIGPGGGPCVLEGKYLYEAICGSDGIPTTVVHECTDSCSNGICTTTQNEPDLLVTNIQPDGNPVAGTDFIVIFYILNRGNTTASGQIRLDVHVTKIDGTDVDDNDPSGYTGYFENILPGQATSIAGKFKYNYAGQKIFNAFVDSLDSVNESDENNNKMSSTITVTEAPITCTDTDGGQSYYVRGYVNLDGYGWDYCNDDTVLMEQDCGTDTNGAVLNYGRTTAYACPNGCQNGACNTQPTCTDSDGGVNYKVKGTATQTNYIEPPAITANIGSSASTGGGAGGISKTDYCSSSSDLTEYWCDAANNIQQKGISCASFGLGSCANGVCTQTSSVKEQVKCVFDNSATAQQCYSEKGSCTGTGTCVVDVAGTKGEKVTWKSTCGGYAYTTMDGQSEYAKFVCGANQTLPTCTDSDGGLEYYIKGSIKSNAGNLWEDQCSNINSGVSSSTNACSGNNCFLYESICQSMTDPSILEIVKTFDGVYTAKTICTYGCSDGACIPPIRSALKLGIETDKSQYSPGERAKITARTYANGNPVDAIVIGEMTQPDGLKEKLVFDTDAGCKPIPCETGDACPMVCAPPELKELGVHYAYYALQKEGLYKFDVSATYNNDVAKASGQVAVTTEPEQDSVKIHTKIKKGWNMISLLNFGAYHTTTTCKASDIKSIYSYFPIERKYGLFQLKGGDFRSEVAGVSNTDQALLDKYRNPTDTGYLISTIINSVWVYSKSNCEIYAEYPSDTQLDSILEQIARDNLKLAQGWNFFTVLPEMKDKTMNELSGECAITSNGAYIYDSDNRKWINAFSRKFSGDDIGNGILIKVVNDCVFGGSENNGPPPLPENTVQATTSTWLAE